MSEILKINSIEKVTDVTTRITCPLNAYACRDVQMNENSLQQHYLSEQHQKSLGEHAQHINENENDDSTDTNIDMIEGNESSSTKAYEKLLLLTENVEKHQEDLTRLNENLIRSKNQVSSLSRQSDNILNTSALEASSIDAISINENILKQELADLKQRVENGNGITTYERDGIMVWRINSVSEKMYDAKSERQTSIYSSPFHTSPYGYKLCIRLYFNGDGSARNTHLSIFLVVLRGDYDKTLEWPLRYRAAFCLYDQRTMIETNGGREPKHIVDCFRPDINSVSFQQPSLAINIASGIPKFCPLAELYRPANENLYIINDTMFIKVFIDFDENTPRSMLSFIFNINISLPAHIRQKLIAEEKSRRLEKTNS